MSARILVVEPQTEIAEALALGLTALGILVDTAGGHHEGRGRLLESRYDALVLSTRPKGWDELVTMARASLTPVLLAGPYEALTKASQAGYEPAYYLEEGLQAQDLARALAAVWGEPDSGFAQRLANAIDLAGLTAKEAACCRLLMKGLATSEIAGITGNSEKTLKHHIASIFSKFKVESRAQLFRAVFPT